jgi:hypothetical protein
MTTHETSTQHPSLLRTTAALDAVGARQGANALPSIAQSLLMLGLSIAAVAAMAFG